MKKLAMIIAKSHLLFVMLVSVTLCISSCDLLDTDAPEAMFIHVPSVTVSTKAGQGEPTHKISDVWLNANGQNLGVYELPATIPVIIDDISSLEVTLLPGIRNNGIKEDAFIYTLMAGESYDVAIESGSTVTLTPEFKYSDNAMIAYAEGFETSNSIIYEGVSNDNGSLVTTTEDARSGNRCGKISLSQNSPTVEIGSITSFARADNGVADTYIELDYKCDVPFSVGVYSTSTTGVTTPIYKVFVVEQEEWNKIYIDYTLELASPSIQDYRIMFISTLEGLEATEGTILLDNIKLVHF